MPTPIAILGSGISALTTALTLRRQGRAFTLYSDPAFNAASAVAPAMFTPYAPEPDAAFRRRTELSLRAFTDLATARTPGIHFGELREYLYTPSPAPSWLESLLHTRDISAPPPVRRATASHRPHIEMDRYLPWLCSQLPSPIPLRAPTFDNVFARGHSILINCTGLGARALTSDALLKPMHGQVLHVPNDLGLTYSLHDDAPGGLVAYIFNFGDRLILGGTFETGREDAGTDEITLAAIVDRCRNLLRLDGHARWSDLARTRLAVRAAARPTRGGPDTFEAIRLEREDLPGNRRIIHNYGHGRTGVTLSWGCAAEAAHLARAD